MWFASAQVPPGEVRLTVAGSKKTPKQASRERATGKAAAQTRRTIMTPGTVVESGTAGASLARLAGAAVRAARSAVGGSGRGGAKPPTGRGAGGAAGSGGSGSVGRGGGRAGGSGAGGEGGSRGRATRDQNKAARTYITKDPAAVDRGRKAAATRAENIERQAAARSAAARRAGDRAGQVKGAVKGATLAGGAFAAADGPGSRDRNSKRVDSEVARRAAATNRLRAKAAQRKKK